MQQAQSSLRSVLHDLSDQLSSLAASIAPSLHLPGVENAQARGLIESVQTAFAHAETDGGSCGILAAKNPCVTASKLNSSTELSHPALLQVLCMCNSVAALGVKSVVKQLKGGAACQHSCL